MYVLSGQLDGAGDPDAAFRRYAAYLARHRARFPAAAWQLASSGRLLDATDPDCPHDAWLEWAKFEESSRGERSELRALSLRIRLLGARHDRHIELFYPQVFSYAFSNACASAGHFDWRYSEIRLKDASALEQGTGLDACDRVIHEIEWAGPPGREARWIIEASDVRLEVFPIDAT